MHSTQRQRKTTIALVVDFPVNSLWVEKLSRGTGWALFEEALGPGTALVLAWAEAGFEQSLEGQAATLDTGALMSRNLLVGVKQINVAPVAVYY